MRPPRAPTGVTGLRRPAGGHHRGSTRPCPLSVPAGLPRPVTLEPHMGTNPFATGHDGAEPPRGWPNVIFQVFWCPSQAKRSGEELVVLLGEAVAPPLPSLGPLLRPHRLILHQLDRRPPQGSEPFEYWLEHILPDFVDRQLHEMQQQEEAELRFRRTSKRDKFRQRHAHLQNEELVRQNACSLLDAGPSGQGPILRGALEGCWTTSEVSCAESLETSRGPFERDRPRPLMKPTCPTLEELSGGDGCEIPPLRLACGAVARFPRQPVSVEGAAPSPRRAADGEVNSSSSDGRIAAATAAARFGAAYAGSCCLDVDLAWRHSDGEAGDEFVPGEWGPGFESRPGGSLEVLLRHVRLPPCAEGRVCVRVCEVESPAKQPQVQGSHELPMATPPLPRFQETHPVWTSPFVFFDADQTPCFAAWPGGLAATTAAASAAVVNGSRSCAMTRAAATATAAVADAVASTAFAVLPIKRSVDLVRMRLQRLIDDSVSFEPLTPIGSTTPTAETAATAGGSTPWLTPRMEVSYDWHPVQLTEPKPIPRCTELMEHSALFEPPAGAPGTAELWVVRLTDRSSSAARYASTTPAERSEVSWTLSPGGPLPPRRRRPSSASPAARRGEVPCTVGRTCPRQASRRAQTTTRRFSGPMTPCDLRCR
eukprot:TRINITY_DN61001_c0_g1_i1.p1 TRINITY_DN61001_c0_g1~~TRINITY_DN61001_c0_g1_i1.p1  ORF type:complete len:652 (-),score=81.47 TRINITY_DN61001_c0_g1_i1:95-2050(-)